MGAEVRAVQRLQILRVTLYHKEQPVRPVRALRAQLVLHNIGQHLVGAEVRAVHRLQRMCFTLYHKERPVHPVRALRAVNLTILNLLEAFVPLQLFPYLEEPVAPYEELPQPIRGPVHHL